MECCAKHSTSANQIKEKQYRCEAFIFLTVISLFILFTRRVNISKEPLQLFTIDIYFLSGNINKPIILNLFQAKICPVNSEKSHKFRGCTQVSFYKRGRVGRCIFNATQTLLLLNARFVRAFFALFLSA